MLVLEVPFGGSFKNNLRNKIFSKARSIRADFREGDEDNNFSNFRVHGSLNAQDLFTELPFL